MRWQGVSVVQHPGAQRTGETGFGVEQELTRDDHAFTTGQACHDLRAPLHATSHTHPHWPEAPVRILHDDPAVPPGGDQRLRGNDWQGLLGVGLHQNLGEHARHQPTLRVAQHIRARCVRLAMSTWGSNAWICPAKRSAGQALTVACTEVPGRKVPSAAWGTEASSHNVSSPLILNSGVPGITVCPSRARISVTTPL